MFDALVIGAGPSGLALAILLAQAGRRVKVIERRSGVSAHSRAIGLHPPGLAVLDRVGVGTLATEMGIRIRQGLGISRGRVVGALDFAVVPGPHPYVLALPQNETLGLLRQRLRQLDPRALLEGAEYLGHGTLPDGKGIHARISRGQGPEDTQRMEARWFIGADGIASSVRASLDVPFQGRRLPDAYTMGDYPDTTDFGPTAALFLHRRGIIESFPLPGAQRRWVAHTGGEGLTDLPRLVTERTGYRLEPGRCSMRSEFTTANRQVPAMIHGRSVLIGDAAHEVSPIGGQGMTLGLLDAAGLAEILLAGHSETGRGQALARFERQRLQAARRAARQAHVNMALGRPLHPWLVPPRDLLFGALASSGRVRGAVARTFTMTSG